MIYILVITSLMSSIGTYVDKNLVNMGISRRDYFYYMCFSMVPFSLIMIAIEVYTNQFKFSIGIIPLILLIIAMYLRYKKQHTLVSMVKVLNPYEFVSYMSLGVVLAYIIDIILKIKDFNVIIISSIVLTLFGVFTLTDVKVKMNVMKKDFIIRLICEIAMGYVTHYILKYWSNASFIFILNLLLTLIFSKDYTFKYHKNNKKIIKWIFIQQIFGFFAVYFGNYLAINSATLASYTKPVSIVLTVLIAFCIKDKNKKPKVKDIFAVFLVAIGIALLNIVI